MISAPVSRMTITSSMRTEAPGNIYPRLRRAYRARGHRSFTGGVRIRPFVDIKAEAVAEAVAEIFP